MNKPTSMFPLALGAVCVALTAVVIVPRASAQTKKVSAAVSGTLSEPATGPCPGSDYSSECAAGPCFHFTAAGSPKISGSFGKGKVTDLCITEDDGNSSNGLITDGGTPGSNTCDPAFGSLTIEVTSKKGATVNTQINLVGSLCWCQVALGSNAVAFQGGFGIIGAGSTDMAETGWGTMTGNIIHPAQTFTFKLNGSYTP